MTYLKKHYLDAICILSITVIYSLVYFNHPTRWKGPDRFYHFAVSRMIAEQGFVKNIPQVEGLKWDKGFAEKEFLFHQFTGLAYFLAGEDGVAYVAFLLSIAALLVLYFIARLWLPPPMSVLPILCVAIANDVFIRRLIVIRPHLSALLFFSLFLLFLLRKRPKALFVSACLFSMSYHAFYVPMMVLVFALCFYSVASTNWIKTIVHGALGLVAGVFLNPYFPKNVKMSWYHLQNSNLQKSLNVNFGMELYSLPANDFFKTNIFFILILAFGSVVVLYFGREKSDDKVSTFVQPFMLLLAFAFFSLYCMHRRAIEYCAPIMLILFAVSLSRLPYSKKAIAAIVVLISFIQAPAFVHAWKTNAEFSKRHTKQILSTIKSSQIPLGAKVFNCDWHSTPFLLYLRPDLKFVDILDPALLYFSSPEKYFARSSILKGRAGDLFQIVQGQFNASYVLCADPTAKHLFDQDPRFKRHYKGVVERMGANNWYYNVYEVLEDHHKWPIVQGYTSKSHAAVPLRDFKTVQASSFVGEIKHHKGSFVKFKTSNFSEPKAMCSLVSPEKAELEKFSGASHIGLGGGRNLRLWVNGEPLFDSRNAYANSKTVSVLVPLESKLKSSDRVELVVCSASDASYWQASMSFWSLNDFDSVCPEDISSNPSMYTEIASRNCIAPIAAKAVR